jgi:hypothetical protein
MFRYLQLAALCTIQKTKELCTAIDPHVYIRHYEITLFEDETVKGSDYVGCVIPSGGENRG